MEDARYHREKAEHCLQMAGHMSDPLAANVMRAAAARHLARAIELEQKAELTKEAEKRSDVSDSLYHRAIRTSIGQGLRSQPTPTEPPPQQVLDALRELDGQEDDRAGDAAGSSVPPGETRET
jgi:hypothetical protein